MPQRRHCLAAAAATMLGTGCAGPPTWVLPASLPRRAAIEALPFVAQTDRHCGPAALAMALQAVRLPARESAIDTDFESLSQAVFLPGRGGSLQTEMLAGTRRAGAVAIALPPSLPALLQTVAEGFAPIVLLNLAFGWAPQWHYALVSGFDLEAGEIVLRSGRAEREPVAIGTFDRVWARADRWAFAAVPPGALPQAALRADAEAAAIGFERSFAAAPAAAAWSAVLQRWPQSLLAELGVGNAHFAAGALHSAAQAFERAARLHRSAAAWHNLALTRQALGDAAGARAAIDAALDRALVAEPEWLEAVRAAQKKLGARPELPP
jgi:tetratricopeptide (TPR) repeat protein